MRSGDCIRNSATTVMVTGVGSNIGQRIVKALRTSGLGQRIIGTDMSAMSAGLFRSDKGYIVLPADSYAWPDKIIDICKKERVDIILAGSDSEVPWETAEFLKRSGLHYPESIPGHSVIIER